MWQSRTLLILLVAAVVTVSAQAEWSTNPLENNPVCIADSAQSYPVIVSDGNGGSIIAWDDNRSGTTHIYAQRLDPDGVPLWVPNGIRVCTYNSQQQVPRMIEDGEGGALIVWSDGTYPSNRLYCQRVDAEGNLEWNSSGIYVSSAGSGHYNAQITTDAFSGMVITWCCEIGNQPDIYVQRIRDDGTRGWGDAGLAACNNGEDQWYPTIIPYAGGGAFVAWEDKRDGDTEIYAQKVWSNGTLGWAADGLRLTDTSGENSSPAIAKHPNGGFIAAWVSSSSSYEDWVFCQQFNYYGEPQWGLDYPVAVSDEPVVDQRNPELAVDTSGKTFITWESRIDSWDIQLYTQCIGPTGSRLWGLNAVPVRVEALIAGACKVVPDGDGGCLIGWLDARHDPYLLAAYAQRFDMFGIALWQENGVMASPSSSYSSDLFVDSDGGVTFAISEILVGDYDLDAADIYAQRVDPTGFLGRPRPVITEVNDFPNDQGGEVLIAWDRVSTDDWPWYAAESYSVWAREMDGALRKTDPGFIKQTASELGLSIEKVTEFIRTGWTFVNSVPAMQQAEYSCAAFTFGDSTAIGIPWMEYKVVAHSDAPWRYWESDVMSGYSVDNIAPGAPVGLAVESSGDASVSLAWIASGSDDEDLFAYYIYRGDEAGFALFDDHLIGTSTEPEYLDPSGLGTWFYRVTAVDVHGNEGLGSNEVEVVVVSSDVADEAGIPGRTLMYTAAPNPFANRVNLRFDLAEAMRVDLGIWSVDGRRLATLASGTLNAGSHQVEWHGRDTQDRNLPHGVYFVRFQAGAYSEEQRLLLIR